MGKWKMMRLGDVCLNTDNENPTLYDQEIVYIDISSIDSTRKKITSYNTIPSKEAPSRARQKVFMGDILVSTVRPNLNAVAVVDTKANNMIASTGFCVLRPDKKHIIGKYLFEYVKSPDFINSMSQQASGASYPAVTNKIVLNEYIPLPPLNVQQKIADVLNKASALIELRKAQLDRLDLLIKAQFIEMFGDPVADSMKWGITLLGRSLGSIRYGTSTPPIFSDSGFAFIRATNIKSGAIIEKDMKYISTSEAEKISRCKLNGDEIIIVRSGVNAGDSCIVTDKYKGQYAGYDIIMVLSKAINPTFLNVLLNTAYKDKVVKPMTRRAAQPHLNSEQVQSFPIINVPITQQNQFASFVKQVEAQKKQLQQSLEKLELNYKSLIQKCFRGEIF